MQLFKVSDPILALAVTFPSQGQSVIASVSGPVSKVKYQVLKKDGGGRG